jgi:hypothetical protein
MNQQLVESIAKVANHLESVAPKFKKVSAHEYELQRQRKPLARATHMGGIRLREHQLSNEEIDLLNKIKPGTYNNGRWVVIAQNTDGGKQSIDIRVPNKTREEQMQLAMEAPSLTALCQKILSESK